jgi:hypothetical protein
MNSAAQLGEEIRAALAEQRRPPVAVLEQCEIACAGVPALAPTAVLASATLLAVHLEAGESTAARLVAARACPGRTAALLGAQAGSLGETRESVRFFFCYLFYFLFAFFFVCLFAFNGFTAREEAHHWTRFCLVFSFFFFFFFFNLRKFERSLTDPRLAALVAVAIAEFTARDPYRFPAHTDAMRSAWHEWEACAGGWSELQELAEAARGLRAHSFFFRFVWF